VLGVVAGIGVIAGVGYLIARAVSSSPSQPSAPTEPPPVPASMERAEPSCRLPVAAVLVCLSTQGYRFAIPSPGICGEGSRPAGIVDLTCDALSHPAYHACIDAGSGAWSPLPSWETCASRGLSDARGDFVPPGRDPALGVAPDVVPPTTSPTPTVAPPTPRPPSRILACFNADGRVVPVVGSPTCRAAGYLDAPPEPPAH
jgi:hypothetical protein